MTPRKRYSFWITDAQHRGLKAIKRAEDTTESEQIRQALNAYLRRKKREQQKTERPRSRTRKRS